MAIRIIVDSSADMEEDYAAAHGIQIIPMTISFGDDSPFFRHLPVDPPGGICYNQPT